MTEAEAIPYQAALLRGERMLVLAPHPDDEVIGCGGLVAQHLRENRAVRIVIATDGARAGNAAAREDESRRGIAALGNTEVVFFGFPDRTLGDDAAPRIREQLLEFRPDLVLVPSPVEIHPDHIALSRVFCQTIQRDETLFADLALTRVAFYEVSAPLPRPNAIVDISDVAEIKYAAIAEHASQLEFRDYVSYARGLNTYRTMTLPAEVKFAEAYFVVDLPSLRTTPFSELQRTRAIETPRQTLPVSVVIRTKDRPALLAEAIASVRATGYPCEIVVVNDGGTRPEVEGVTLVHHEESRGRSEAANAGVRAASNAYITFLDDDDLFYPEHLATLANAAAGSNHVAHYSDSVSAFLHPGENGSYETYKRLRFYAQDFDRELLLLDNYIPLPALLFKRETFLDLSGFDTAFDLFEDWDFLIRLSQRGSFLRVPRITCEVRHFEGGESVVLAAPEGSARFREAKLQVWRKHAALLDHNVIADAFERQKRRSGAMYAELVETKGQVHVAQIEIARSTRESIERMNTINGYALRVRELEGSLATSQATFFAAEAALNEKQDLLARLDAKTAEAEGLRRETHELRAANENSSRVLEQLHVEIDRLNGLLEMIYRSKTWKLHTTLEKLRGRG
ncbi:MAG TPA: PIG-L family deacetylase [Thermoanaerobaculia bacterium]|nr:PIG-L family deacetylase [Thermoanaerobaculia bacterium]